MTSKVKVNMRVCDKTHLIEVEMSPEMEFTVRAETDCKNVREFIDKLGTLTMSDLTDKKEGRVWVCFRNVSMSPNCLVPAAVLDAAWMEAGMLSKNRAQACGFKSIEYPKD
ncbi:MAG: hypothetical protein LUQ39_04280 [Methanomassiliicoccales archaeon]|nr:hypothetical protein [Methanomassiliicoccales archaeon]